MSHHESGWDVAWGWDTYCVPKAREFHFFLLLPAELRAVIMDTLLHSHHFRDRSFTWPFLSSDRRNRQYGPVSPSRPQAMALARVSKQMHKEFMARFRLVPLSLVTPKLAGDFIFQRQSALKNLTVIRFDFRTAKEAIDFLGFEGVDSRPEPRPKDVAVPTSAAVKRLARLHLPQLFHITIGLPDQFNYATNGPDWIRYNPRTCWWAVCRVIAQRAIHVLGPREVWLGYPGMEKDEVPQELHHRVMRADGGHIKPVIPLECICGECSE